MKKILVITSVIILFLAACTKENFKTEINNSLSQSFNNSVSLKGEFRRIGNGLDWTYSRVGRLPRRLDIKLVEVPNFANMQVLLESFEHVNQSSGLPTGKRMHKPIYLTLEMHKSIAKLSAESIEFFSPIENKIQDVVLTYISEVKVVETTAFSIFVFENGKAALQNPYTSNWIYENGGITHQDDWDVKVTANIEDDPANEISSVEIKFDDRFEGSKPTQLSYLIDRKKGNEDKLKGLISFTENPAGFTYTVSYILKDAKGNLIGIPKTEEIKIQKENIPTLKSIHIREVVNAFGGISYLLVATGENNSMNGVKNVELEFIKPFNGVEPATAKVVLWRMRKKPEILYQAWDNVIDEHLTEIQNHQLTDLRSMFHNNPIFNESGVEFNPLFDLSKASPVGSTYTVVATMKKENGKTVGEPTKFEVTVEGRDVVDNPEVKAADIVSYDGGKTWLLQVKVAAAGNTIEKITGSFVADKTVPLPVKSDFDLTLTDKGDGTILTYSATVQFMSNPVNSCYNAVITMFASNKYGSKPSEHKIGICCRD